MALTWGVEASPFLLKLEAALRCKHVAFRRLPRDDSRWENLLTALRLHWAVHRQQVLRYPRMDQQLDEYPSVPFFSVDGKEFQYDSSSLILWLDQESGSADADLIPEDPGLRFIAALIDEAFDEYGLYMVHHQRWVFSAEDNIMGEATAAEMARLLPPPLPAIMRKQMPRRQSRRCPYLFSVAPAGYSAAATEPRRVPPSRPGFPATHSLLDESWRAYLAAMEAILTQQPYVLGDRFSIADASAYGQLRHL